MTSIATAIAIAAVVVSGGGGGSTANVWMNTAGNDSTCTRSATAIADPGGGADCVTAAKAWAIASAGDTIRVDDGTYTNTGLAGSECAFAAGKASDTTFVGSTNAKMPCFWNLDSEKSWHMVVNGLALSLSNIAGSNVTIENGIMTCTDASPYTLFTPDSKCSARLSFTGTDVNITILNETIGPSYESGACGGNAPNGADFFGVTGPVLLKNVTFFNARRGCGNGVQHQENLRMEAGNSNVTLDHVVIYNDANSGWWNGSSFDGSGANSAELFITGTQTTLTIQNSYCYGTGNVCLDGASDSNFVSNSQFRNNVFANGTLMQHAYPSDFLITDNLFPSCLINAGQGSSGGTTRRNVSYGSGTSCGGTGDVSTATALSAIVTNSSTGAFTLLAGTNPAVDAGGTTSGDYAATDAAGTSRFCGSAADAGAYERCP